MKSVSYNIHCGFSRPQPLYPIISLQTALLGKNSSTILYLSSLSNWSNLSYSLYLSHCWTSENCFDTFTFWSFHVFSCSYSSIIETSQECKTALTSQYYTLFLVFVSCLFIFLSFVFLSFCFLSWLCHWLTDQGQV